MPVIYLTDPSVTSFTVPADWNNADNSVSGIGAGAGGRTSSNLGSDRSSGGGGAYAGQSNVALDPGGVVPVTVGAGSLNGGLAGDTSFGTVMRAKGANGRFGGKASECIGEVAHSGGDGILVVGTFVLAPGGGAAGLHGNGESAPETGSRGGNGDAGFGGAGGLSGRPAGPGHAGTEWDGVYGSGGGGGAGAGFNANGGAGGAFGGGGGGGGANTGHGGPGAAGVLRISYNP